MYFKKFELNDLNKLMFINLISLKLTPKKQNINKATHDIANESSTISKFSQKKEANINVKNNK